MATRTDRLCCAARLAIVLGSGLFCVAPCRSVRAEQTYPAGGIIRQGDRIAWVGSSSTGYGIWPNTMEFLLKTRHPTLNLTFWRFSTGGGTFLTGRENLDAWLDESQATLVFLNYGGNDAADGLEGLERFKENIAACAEIIKAHRARMVLVTPQAADARKSGKFAAVRRTLYAETMLVYGRERGWPVIDVHHPLDALQLSAEAVDPRFSMLKDSIHLTHPAYVAWGFYLFDRLDLPFARSAATLTADGEVKLTENCAISEVELVEGVLSFTRSDDILPVFPPGPLPPRHPVPLEAHSKYMLRVTGLEPAVYEVRCLGRPVGKAGFLELAAGVNLNALLIESKNEAPWAGLSRAIWDGHRFANRRVGETRWRFQVRKLPASQPSPREPGGS